MWAPISRTVYTLAMCVVVFCLIAAAAMIASSLPTSGWKTTIGDVTDVRLLDEYRPYDWRTGRGHRQIHPDAIVKQCELEYTYRVGGQQFTGKDETVLDWQKGLPVLYNPANPAESALHHGPDAQSFVAVICVAAVAYVVGRIAGVRK